MCCCARLEVCESCSPCRYVFRTNANLTCVCLSKTLVPVFDLCHRQAPLAQKLSQACCWTSLGLFCVVGPILGGVLCGLFCSSVGALIIVASFNYFLRGDGVLLTFWFRQCQLSNLKVAFVCIVLCSTFGHVHNCRLSFASFSFNNQFQECLELWIRNRLPVVERVQYRISSSK